MDHTDVIGWVLSVCNGLRLSQAKTLSALVASTLQLGRVNLAEIGRGLLGAATAKSRIQRTWRFTANTRVVISDAMGGVIAKLLGRRQRKPTRRKKALLIALDWTEIRNFHTLMAAAVLKGRAVPLLWASYPEWVLHKSQNNLEEGLLCLLRTLVPDDVRVILLADRGFGRTELARTCQRLGFHYVIRIRPDVWVHGVQFHGKLLDFPVRRGTARLLRHVAFRKNDPVRQNVVIRWKPGLPKKRDEPWFLMTDLTRGAESLSDLYGQRMTIEELFRDHKNRRNGWALRHTKITKADRLDRLLLILALTYVLQIGLGLVAQQRCHPAAWCSSSRTRHCSVFTIGRIMLHQLQVSVAEALTAVIIEIRTAAAK